MFAATASVDDLLNPFASLLDRIDLTRLISRPDIGINAVTPVRTHEQFARADNRYRQGGIVLRCLLIDKGQRSKLRFTDIETGCGGKIGDLVAQPMAFILSVNQFGAGNHFDPGDSAAELDQNSATVIFESNFVRQLADLSWFCVG